MRNLVPALAFSALVYLSCPGTAHPGDLIMAHDTADGTVSISNTGIALSDRDGRPLSEYSVEPMRIVGCCSDEAGENLFVILGREGGDRGERLAVYSIRDGAVHCTWKDEDRGLNPWKIVASDVDGDGRLDVSVGVWKKARFHPVYANRLFVYDWDGRCLFPKWLGSRLASPFIDFTYADLDGDGADELLSLELQKDGGRMVRSYRWAGFGFRGQDILARDVEYTSLDNFRAAKGAP